MYFNACFQPLFSTFRVHHISYSSSSECASVPTCYSVNKLHHLAEPPSKLGYYSNYNKVGHAQCKRYFVISVLEATVLESNLNTCHLFISSKQSLYGPGQTLMVPEGCGFQISRQSAHEGGKVVRPTDRPPLPHRKYSWHSFLLEDHSAIRRIMSVTPSGNEPATFRLVAPTNCATECPSVKFQLNIIFLTMPRFSTCGFPFTFTG